MKVISPRDQYDVLIAEQINRGLPVDEVLRNVLIRKAKARQVSRIAESAGLDNRTLSRFATNETVNMTFVNLESVWNALGYRVTLERL